MEDLQSIIREHLFFQGMNQCYIKLLSGCAKNVRFEKEEFIFREGEHADTFYCIRSGNVALEIHAAQRGIIRIDNRSQGDILGWSWIVPPHRWYCDSRAVETVRALAFDGKCLRDKCEDDVAFGYEIYKRFVTLMHRSLQATRIQLLDIYAAE